MDRLSVDITERHHSIGLTVDGEAVLVGQLIGRGAEVDVATVVSLCQEAGALSVESAASDILLEVRRVSGRALSAEGLRVSSDVAVPVARLAEMLDDIQRIGDEEGVEIPTFAHAGDGNLHPSVIVRTHDDEARAHAERVLDRISDAALALGGTLSGEHGVGSLKRPYLAKQLDEPTLATHRLIKDAFDPHHILSPNRAI
jgi:glycolate oxidase